MINGAPKGTPVDIKLSFVNKVQEDFFYETKRNQCFSGGYGNGKSFGGSMKALTLLTTFPKYKFAISRYRSKDLVASTMATFFKNCPPDLYNEAYGGRRNDRDGYLRLINGSEVEWIHLDDYSENTLRGREYNSHLGDQMEEVSEGVYITIDSRIERWDMAEIPSHMNPDHFPKNKFSGKPMPPCYNMILCNPDSTIHWIYERYHPDSPNSAKYADTHAFYTASMHDNAAIPQSLKDSMLSRDKAWVDRFYWGKWGISGGSIHYVDKQSILSTGPENSTTQITEDQLAKLFEAIKRDGIKYRVMDHGDAAPTCVLWFAWLSPSILERNYGIISRGIHVCYREYYQPDKLISHHREQIAQLSGDEKYHGNYADPSIFNKAQQKYDIRWSTADEYLDGKIKAPKIMWLRANNDEMSTRNAIGELLQLNPGVVNPFTEANKGGAPSLYFIKKNDRNALTGCSHVINQLQAAKHKKIGTFNGKDEYSDERDSGVADHAYDPLRYYCIIPKMADLPEKPIEIPQFSFNSHFRRTKINRFRSYKGKGLGR